MPISALDKDTAKLLTTTQIITSVSSAAKELIENALDANARSIEINLIDNGTTLIEIKDDGHGISKADASYMALPSYTSKISHFADLELLKTYGFRGEALSALSVVADITIVTKTEQEDSAMMYTIDHHGQIIKSEPSHRTTGTTVQVKELFKRMPVRRQIISNPKKANQDVKVLESLIKSYGICKFLVRMSYRVNNNIVLAKPGTNTMKESVTYILGKKAMSNMSWIEIEETDINIRLMVPSKEASDVPEIFQTGAQYLFANNRPIKHKELEKVVTKTILEGLKQDGSTRKKPIFLVHILLDASSIDVNLDPNKTSILFKEQQAIFDAVDKHLRTFYGIAIEEVEENSNDKTFNYYQDYTTNEAELSVEWPVCKRRRIQTDESVNEKERSEIESCNNGTVQKSHNENRKLATESVQIRDDHDHLAKGRTDVDVLNHLSVPILSDSDSNDTENFIKIDTDDTNKDSLPFEFSQSTPAPPELETLSQIPVVDLGEDFVLEDYLQKHNESSKENLAENENAKLTPKDLKKFGTLETWSKGQVPGLKGGTDVLPYVNLETNKSSDVCSFSESYRGSTASKGLILFSRHIRKQVLKDNPEFTPPQVALRINHLWKRLSSEERGYYRDLEKDAQAEREAQKKEKKEKLMLQSEKDKNRLLTMLEKMKHMKTEKKENLVMRTTVPWDVDLKAVTKCFLNKPSYENTNPIVGTLNSNLWMVNKSRQIWVLDFARLKKELNISEDCTNQDDAENVSRLFQQWFLNNSDPSILHPIHSLE